jgi:hypothetical protein
MINESHIYQLVKNIYGSQAELVAIDGKFIRLKISEELYFWARKDHWKPLDFDGTWY